MQPIQDVLHRIRWDAEFGRGAFAIAYWDRVASREEHVPLASVAFDAADPRALRVTDADGSSIRLPLHRVRAVYRDDVEIWRRPPRDPRRAGHG
ncbi:MAG: DUF504 domain-containing protein [Acidobacteria bacterium]|nr:DUF504 domain-containing protein [Acidobacteriota bacterium]